MPEYPDSGLLFSEERKSNPRGPDYRGEGRIDCPHCACSIELRLSGWLKVGRAGAKFLSLSFRSKAVGRSDEVPMEAAADERLPF
jgi:hypothetical protein